MKFSALAGNGMQRVSSDAATVLFFLKEEKEKNGGAKRQANALIGPFGIYSAAAIHRENRGRPAGRPRFCFLLFGLAVDHFAQLRGEGVERHCAEITIRAVTR